MVKFLRTAVIPFNDFARTLEIKGLLVATDESSAAVVGTVDDKLVGKCIKVNVFPTICNRMSKTGCSFLKQLPPINSAITGSITLVV